MSARLFLDSNVLLYACSGVGEDRRKKEVSERLLSEQEATISSQVLQEFISNALRKPALGISEQMIDVMLELALEIEVVPVSHELIVKATGLRRRYQLSHWDSTILAAAMEGDCAIIYSEDFQHGQVFGGLRVVNPYLE